MTSHWFFYLFAVAYFLHEGLETILVWLNMRSIQKHQHEIPPYFKDKIDLERYQKGANYNLEKSCFGLLMQWAGVGVTWGILLGGGFGLLDRWISLFVDSSPLTHSVLYCLAAAFFLMILHIPVSLYSQFVIEEKYGFNKMTAKVFVFDLIKSILIGALLGVPLLSLIFWLYEKSGPLWWLWAFLAFFGFELFIATIYPTWLAPIFNKFTPLPEGTLKESILEIAKRINFKLSGIYTIDGSKRSTHSNAYFAGMGRMRRIVLFDTLISQFSEPEIISVLAHEMGHNKKRHIQKQLLLSFGMGLLSFWILSKLIDWPPLYAALNAGDPVSHKGLVLFALFGGCFTFLVTPFFNFLSRKYEYESDRFSVEVTKDKEHMISSLVKLSKENLSNLTPHPLYSFYHYSHPTTLERIQAIEQVQR